MEAVELTIPRLYSAKLNKPGSPGENYALQNRIFEIGLVDHGPVHQSIAQISILRQKCVQKVFVAGENRQAGVSNCNDTSKLAFATTALMK